MTGRTGSVSSAADRDSARSALHLRPLRRRADFLRVARRGAKAVSAGLVLQAAPGAASIDEIGFGLTASRKVGNAVARNRARRRLRALARRHLPRYGQGGMDYVLIARAATVTRPHALLERDFLSALGRVGAHSRRDGEQ